MIDLHVHINEDDAKNPPEVVVEHAVLQGITDIAMVVHDYVGHMARCVGLGVRNGLKSLPVTELTAHDGHYLMFFPDLSAMDDSDFVRRLQFIYDARRSRLQKLADDTLRNPYVFYLEGFGKVEFSFTEDDLDRIASGDRILSGHLAQLLSKRVGGIVSGRSAYDLLGGLLKRECYCSDDCYCTAAFSLDELLDYKKRFGSVLVQAHPALITESEILLKLAKGVDGFELSPKNPFEYNLTLAEYSARHSFLLTVGSDNHMWESDSLGFLAWQPEIAPHIDEKNVVAGIYRLLGR